jgi:hypothetical protein
VPIILLIQPFSVVWEHLIVVPGKSEEEGSEDRSINASIEPAIPKDFDSQVGAPAQQPASLLRYLLTYEPVKPATRLRYRPTPVECILMNSYLFHINVYSIQPAIITAATGAFRTDDYLIGYSTTGNWWWFGTVLGVYVGAAWLTNFCLLPWFTLGKEPKDCRTEHVTMFGEDGTDLSERYAGPATRPP